MKQRLKYFIFNKEQDYKGCWREGLEWDKDGFWLDEKAGGRGIFMSKVLDSREMDTEWHRLAFDPEKGGGFPCRIRVFSSNSLDYIYGGRALNVQEVIEDSGKDFEEKLRLLEGFERKKEMGTGDMLLFGVRGRYLWIAVELFNRGELSPRLEHLTVYFPKESWISYLPEIYQANDREQFLERYLAVFQTLHEEMNRKIREIPNILDVDSADYDYLVWLSGWLDIAGSYMWSEKQLAALLRNGVSLYKRRGTRQGILDFIRLYTGAEAFLVEYQQLDYAMSRQGLKEWLARLYTASPYTLTILLPKEHVPTQKEYKSLLRVIDEIKPAQMETNLIVLEPYMFLGGHTYMGINSALGEYRDLSLDGLSMLPFSAISI